MYKYFVIEKKVSNIHMFTVILPIIIFRHFVLNKIKSMKEKKTNQRQHTK